MPTKKIDATRPLYALVGVTDLAVEYARNAAAEAQTRFAKVDIEPKALREQALTVVASRIDELAEDAKEAPAKVEAYAEKARTQVESYLNDTVAEMNETYGELAVRGRDLVARIRRQQATQDAKAATRTTVAKAKTAKTQTARSAKASTATTKATVKRTAGTAKRSTKATTTSAKKAASATTRAVGDAAEKVGD